MRLLVAVGALSVAGSLLVACGDDDDSDTANGGSGGRGGSGGAAGSSGSGGAAGTAGSSSGGAAGAAGAAGTAGAAGAAGAAGTSGGNDDPDAGGGDPGDAGDGGAPPCTGCLELRAPFIAINTPAFFQLAGGEEDMSTTTLTYRLRAPFLDETGQLQLNLFATDGEDGGFILGLGETVLVNAANFPGADFVDVSVDVGAIDTTDFDPTNVIAIGLQLFAGATFAVPNTAVILLDSVTAVRPAAGDGDAGPDAGLETDVLDFEDSAQGFAVPNFGLLTATITHH
jgi:hypothetical protein